MTCYQGDFIEPASTTSPDATHEIVTTYARTFQGQPDPWLQIPQPTNVYECKESYGSVDSPGGLSGYEFDVASLYENECQGAMWNNGYREDRRDMRLSSATGHREEREGTDYCMTGMGDYRGNMGGVEGSEDQRYRRPPEYDVTANSHMDPYSSTGTGTNSNGLAVTESSRLGIEQISPRNLQNRDQDAKKGEKPPIVETNLEPSFHPSRCLLGCRGNYVFTSRRSYRTHLKNVHNKHIYCSFPGCPHITPFNSRNDQRRHYRAKHDPSLEKSFKCERSICPARVKSWKRKDKLVEHNKKYHMQIPCHICSQHFDNFEELSQHTNYDHSINSLEGWSS